MDAYMPIFLSTKQYDLLTKGETAVASSREGRYDVFKEMDINGNWVYEKENFIMPLLIPPSYLLRMSEKNSRIIYVIRKKDTGDNK